jgi:preprotein translocase subunit YajC
MHLNEILAQATAPQTTPAGTQGAQPQSSPFGLFIPVILMFVIVYFMMLRPQSQQRKQQAKLLETLKSGDKVVTSSGIVGVVITVKDTTVSLRSADAKMEVTKSSVTQILEGGTPTES